ncbi:hypothetical protein [Mycolicibacterium holsaticum]|nr:hypothetical protein [Mycolicibacterium holsaticum]
MNDIVSELVGVYGVGGNEAVNIAKQALASVFGEGPYCDRYYGG